MGAIYNRRTPPFSTLGHLVGPERDLSEGGLAEADYLPGGFLLTKMSVFEKIPEPWFFETSGRTGGKFECFIEMMADQFGSMIPQPVQDVLSSSPVFLEWLNSKAFTTFSEDYNFSRKARRYGFKLWCDLNITWEMGHIGEQIITCKPKHLIEAEQKMSATIPGEKTNEAAALA